MTFFKLKMDFRLIQMKKNLNDHLKRTPCILCKGNHMKTLLYEINHKEQSRNGENIDVICYLCDPIVYNVYTLCTDSHTPSSSCSNIKTGKFKTCLTRNHFRLIYKHLCIVFVSFSLYGLLSACERHTNNETMVFDSTIIFVILNVYLVSQ